MMSRHATNPLIRARFLVLTLGGILFLPTVVRSYPPEEDPVVRVGQIFVNGNTKTRDSIILSQLSLCPGQVLDVNDLCKAEANLAQLNRFVVDSEKGIRPTVRILDNPNDPNCEYKDILVTVQENESTNLFVRLSDGFEEWGFLLTVRTRVIMTAVYSGYYLYHAYSR